MLRERVSNNIYVFTSELYAQVTAGAILTGDGAIVIDTLPFPVETLQIIHFIEERNKTPVRYVVNTHYHADHTYGTSLFKHARVISHQTCLRLLDTKGREGLERAQRSSHEMAAVQLRLPDILFDGGKICLHLGGFTLEIWHSPGHSLDSVVCLAREERILFAADTLMPIPFFSDGSWSDYVTTLESLLPEAFENVVQGHGEVILRGEVQDKIREDLAYLHEIRERVERIVAQKQGIEALSGITLESCGKSRIPLNGLVQQLHRSNLETLYQQMKESQGRDDKG